MFRLTPPSPPHHLQLKHLISSGCHCGRQFFRFSVPCGRFFLLMRLNRQPLKGLPFPSFRGKNEREDDRHWICMSVASLFTCSPSSPPPRFPEMLLFSSQGIFVPPTFPLALRRRVRPPLLQYYPHFASLDLGPVVILWLAFCLIGHNLTRVNEVTGVTPGSFFALASTFRRYFSRDLGRPSPE